MFSFFGMDYRLKDRAVLQTDDDRVLVEEVIRPIWDLPWPDDDRAALPRQWKRVREAQRLTYALVWFEREVSNGGIAQYFANPAGSFLDDLREAAQRFDAPLLRRLIATAEAKFTGGSPDRLRAVRELQIASLAAASRTEEQADYHAISVANDNIFREENNQFERAIDEAYAAAARFIRSHVSEFFR